MEHCLDQENLGPIFAFLIPILNLEKQTSWLSLAFAMTVICSLKGREQIDWAVVLHNVIPTPGENSHLPI